MIRRNPSQALTLLVRESCILAKNMRMSLNHPKHPLESGATSARVPRKPESYFLQVKYAIFQILVTLDLSGVPLLIFGSNDSTNIPSF